MAFANRGTRYANLGPFHDALVSGRVPSSSRCQCGQAVTDYKHEQFGNFAPFVPDARENFAALRMATRFNGRADFLDKHCRAIWLTRPDCRHRKHWEDKQQPAMSSTRQSMTIKQPLISYAAFRRSLRIACCFACCSLAAIDSQADDAETIELPHVIAVSRQEGDSDESESAPDEPELPPVVVTPPSGNEPSPVETNQPLPPQGALDTSALYPSLSDFRFEGLTGALRSTRTVFDDPRNVTIMDRERLVERNARDMVEALEREVGVAIQRTGRGQASPFIRGLTGPQTLILVDGIRVNNSTFRFGPNQYFALFDPGMIERIEVVRGPQSVLWGSDAIGGVINIVTRSADRRFGRWQDYFGGQFIEYFGTADTSSYSRMNVEGWVGRGGVFTGASYFDVNNLDRGGQLGRQPFTDYRQNAGDLRFDYLLSDNQWLTVSLQHVEQEGVPRTDRFPGEFRRFDPQQRDLAYVRWQGVNLGGFVDAFAVTASFGRQKERTDRRRPLDSMILDDSQFDVETTGLNFLLGTDLRGLGYLTYGVDWYYDDVDASAVRIDETTNTVTERIPQFPDDATYQRVGAFLQWDLALTDRLTAISGARYSNIDAGATVALFDPTSPGFPLDPPVLTPIGPSFQDWTGSVGLTYELCCDLHLVGSVSEGFRAPLLDELTSVSSNVNEGVDLPTLGLRPERSINYECGVKLNGSRLRGEAFYFWTDIDGLIDRVLVGTDIGDPLDPNDDVNFFQRRNVGSANINGLELAGEYLIGTNWAAYGNFFYTYGLNRTADEPLSRIPPAQGVLGLRWREAVDLGRTTGRNWLTLYAWMVGQQDRLSERDMRDSRIPEGGTPGFATINMRAGRYLGRNQLVSVGLENIFDKAYRVHGSGVDGPGITATLGWQVRR